jgi:hypothetical protein
MATGSRTLKLSILGDVSNLTKSLKAADNDVGGFAGGLEKFSKRAGQAFAVAGAAALAYAGKLAIDGVKAAIEDEKANAKLAQTLINVAGATQGTIEEVLAYSRATELATGVTEDELRPSLNRLAIATGNVEKAMELQGLAIDVAAGSGKGLDAVTQALSKAFEGNTASLGRLGIGISAAELKTLSFDQITKRLSDTFAGQADVAANTYEGRIERLQLAFDDVRDSLAERLLPFIERFINFLLQKGVPTLNSFVDGLTGKNSVNESLTKTQQTAITWGKRVRAVIDTVISFKDELFLLAKVIAGVFVVSAIAGWVSATVAGIKTLIVAYNLLKTSAIVAGVASAFALNPLLGVGAAALAAGVLSAAAYQANQFNTRAPGTSSDLGGMESTGLSAGLYGSTPVNPFGAGQMPKTSKSTEADIITASTNAATKAVAAVTAPKFVTPVNLPALDPALLNYQDSFRTSPMNTTYNVTVNGAVDPIGTARAISDVLGTEATTSGNFNNLGFSRLVAS